MNVVPLYSDVARLVLRPDQRYTTHDLLELAKKIPELRKLLSCVVCRNLVIDPYKPNTGNCQHNVCRLCVRGHKQLYPKCSNCQNRNDFKTYKENRYLSRILFCYKSVCVSMKRTGIYSALSGFRGKNQKSYVNIPSINLPNMTLQEIIQEGSKYDDMMSKFAEDLPQPSIMSNYQSNAYQMQMQSTLLTDDTTFFDMNDEGIEFHEAMQNDDDQQHIEYDMEPQVNTNYLQNTQTMPYQVDLANCLSTTTTTSTLLLPGAVIPMPQATQLSQVLPDMRTETAISCMPTGVARVAPSSHSVVESVNNVTGIDAPPKSLPVIKRRLRIGGVEQVVHKTITHAQAQPLSTTTTIVTTNPAITTTTNALETATIASTTQIPSQKRKHNSISDTDAADQDCITADSSEMQPRKKKLATQDFNVLKSPESTAHASITAATQIRASRSSKSSNKTKQTSCRCGQKKNSKVTCFRQRCPCYRNGVSCNKKCKCIGCNNPKNKEVMNVTSTTTAMEMKTSTIKSHQKPQQQQQPATIEHQQQAPTTISTTTAVSTTTGVSTTTATSSPLNNTNNNQEQFVNLMPQAQHPPVLIQNENGEYQVVNLYTKTGEPVNPETLGLPPITLQTSAGGVNSTITAYVMTAEAKVMPMPPVQSVQPIQNVENVANVEDNDSNQMEQATTTTPMDTETHDAEQQTDEQEQQPQTETRRPKKVNVICVETISCDKFSYNSSEPFDSVDEHVLANVTSDL